MAIVGPIQQATNAIVTGTSVVVTIAAPAAGACLVMTCTGNAGTVNAVSGGGVTWANLHAPALFFGACDIWYGLNSTGSGTSITVTLDASTFAAVNVSEWAGIKTGAADVGHDANGTGTAAAPGSVTPTAAPALLIVTLAHNDSAAPSAGPTGGFSALTTAIAGGTVYNNSAYLIQTVAAAANPGYTMASSVNWEANIGALLGDTWLPSPPIVQPQIVRQ